jgi:hypothetical protein
MSCPMPNASAHLLPEAGATEERTLEAVRCSAVLGAASLREVCPSHATLALFGSCAECYDRSRNT